jgi:hypothetical protein
MELLQEQVAALRADPGLGTVERARAIGYLAGLALQAEHCLLETTRKYIKPEDAMDMINALAEAVRDNVPDVKARQAIQQRYNELMANLVRAAGARGSEECASGSPARRT